MSDQKVHYVLDGGVAVITLNDPTVLNAMDLQMAEQLRDAIEKAASEARAILLTGAGKAFCAGANLSGGDLGSDDHGLPDAGFALETHINPMMLLLRDLPIPIVSSVRGAAAGVGCSLALAADIIFASESAVFVQAFVNIGLVPDGGSTWLISKAIGRARAMEMMLLGEKLPASRAYEWGLVNRLVEDAALDATAYETASRLAKGPTKSMAMIRRNVWNAVDSEFEDVLVAERRLQKVAGNTADHAEGLNAFLAKRRPEFTGA